MQHVQKGPQPQVLIEHIRDYSAEGMYFGPPYNGVSSKLKNELRRILLEEQGYVCCYTGHEIDLDRSHIEHVKAQSDCTALETLDFSIMLAAYPQPPKAKETECGYGARARKNKPVPITPIQVNCGEHFRYLVSGAVEPVDWSDTDAINTIQVLVLQNLRLREVRKSAIDEAIIQAIADFADTDEIISYLTQLVDVMSQRNDDNHLPAFCFVIRSVALDLLESFS